MEMQHLNDLYIEQLKDLYSAEDQLCEALPELTEAVSNNTLRNTLEQHFQQTVTQRDRLRIVLDWLGQTPDGHECKGMKGLIQETRDLLEDHEDADPDVLDAGIIAAAQRIEHYEIAGYGTVSTYAKMLGEREAAQTLERILNEEVVADAKLTQIAERVVNVRAMG
jgi:ferritin-like metal-binding protein YciE